MPRRPLEKMALDRMRFPVPDCTVTPAWALKPIRLPKSGVIPPIVFPDARRIDDHPVDLVAKTRDPRDVGADVVARQQVAHRARHSIRTPQWLAEIRFCASARLPPMVLRPRRS